MALTDRIISPAFAQASSTGDSGLNVLLVLGLVVFVLSAIAWRSRNRDEQRREQALLNKGAFIIRHYKGNETKANALRDEYGYKLCNGMRSHAPMIGRDCWRLVMGNANICLSIYDRSRRN